MEVSWKWFVRLVKNQRWSSNRNCTICTGKSQIWVFLSQFPNRLNSSFRNLKLGRQCPLSYRNSRSRMATTINFFHLFFCFWKDCELSRLTSVYLGWFPKVFSMKVLSVCSGFALNTTIRGPSGTTTYRVIGESCVHTTNVKKLDCRLSEYNFGLSRRTFW